MACCIGLGVALVCGVLIRGMRPCVSLVAVRSQCWCGNSYDKYGKSTRCTMPCAGDDGRDCGGRDALSVYEVEKKRV